MHLTLAANVRRSLVDGRKDVNHFLSLVDALKLFRIANIVFSLPLFSRRSLFYLRDKPTDELLPLLRLAIRLAALARVELLRLF